MPLAPDTNCLKWKIAGAAFVWEGGNTNVCGPKLTIFLFRLCLHLSFIGFFYLFRTPSARQQESTRLPAALHSGQQLPADDLRLPAARGLPAATPGDPVTCLPG